jgi:hypothetical protein
MSCLSLIASIMSSFIVRIDDSSGSTVNGLVKAPDLTGAFTEGLNQTP